MVVVVMVVGVDKGYIVKTRVFWAILSFEPDGSLLSLTKKVSE